MNPLLEKVVGQFRKLRIFRGGVDSVLGIDLGSSAIKVIELKRKHGKAALVKYGSLALGPYAQGGIGEVAKLSNEKLAEAAKVLFTEAGLGSKVAFISIPLKSSLLLLIEIPPVPESKLDSVVPIEARKYIPASSSEVSINWIRVPRKHEGSGWENAEKKDEGKIDKETDAKTKELGETQDNFIITGRTTGHFIPHARKIFLDVEIATGARRIYLEGRDDEHSAEYYDALNKVKKRMASERIRYKQYYRIDIDDPKHYDLYIDTTVLTPEQVVDEILQWLDHGK